MAVSIGRALFWVAPDWYKAYKTGARGLLTPCGGCYVTVKRKLLTRDHFLRPKHCWKTRLGRCLQLLLDTLFRCPPRTSPPAASRSSLAMARCRMFRLPRICANRALQKTNETAFPAAKDMRLQPFPRLSICNLASSERTLKAGILTPLFGT
jgi:hypothetical protein